MKTIYTIIALLEVCLHLPAQDADSTSLRPTFGADFSSEVQTDFEKFRNANLLQLHAHVPLSRKLTFEAGAIGSLITGQELDIIDLQGISNIDTYEMEVPFALTVAGFTWQPGDHHSLFAGIRRTDEDYFCSETLSLFTTSSCGIFPTISMNFPIGTFPYAAVGFHYAYDNENLRLQASLYNGEGNYRFTGPNNVFRFCPESDGLFALAQAEYRHRGSHYYLGASLHSQPEATPTVWTYAEQALWPNLTLLAAYGHAFGSYISSPNFAALGGKYTYKRATFGLISTYARILNTDEFSTEFVCNLQLTSFLALKPAFHIITDDGTTKCVAQLRVNIGI